MVRLRVAAWIVAPVIIPRFLLLLLSGATLPMARATRVPYLVSGTNEYGSSNLGRGTAAVALRLARKLLREGYMDVRICTPRGRLLQSDEFDELQRRATWRRASNAAIGKPRSRRKKKPRSSPRRPAARKPPGSRISDR